MRKLDNYSFYLFCKLAEVKKIKLPYDYEGQFYELKKLFTEFENKEFENKEKSEYERMEEFLNKKQQVS